MGIGNITPILKFYLKGNFMVWTCQNCNTKIEESGFEVCWNCGCEKGKNWSAELGQSTLKCIRCKSPMIKLGSKEFHEGARWGALGNLAELFVNKQTFDIFACQSCGKLEFYLPEDDKN
ncbi:hypothetical protein [Shewanella sp. GXUN23E]|uniref:hypothetical protein n=1 Tax=Shewanella sp. GXUN23E TaxID=3422498 RepID=UPI003D7C6D22